MKNKVISYHKRKRIFYGTRFKNKKEGSDLTTTDMQSHVSMFIRMN